MDGETFTRWELSILYYGMKLEYIRHIGPLSGDESSALHKWVCAGNDLHCNPGRMKYVDGSEADYLDYYRYTQALKTVGITATPDHRIPVNCPDMVSYVKNKYSWLIRDSLLGV